MKNTDSAKPYNNRKVWKRAITSSLGYFAMGYSLNIFNSSQTCVSQILDWGSDEEFFIALMTALPPFGGLFGAIVSGYFTKYYGKRLILMVTDIVTIIGSLINYYPNTISFGIGRFVLGFASGVFSMICAQYVSEFTPPEVYSKMGVVGPLHAMTGNLLSNIVCQPLPVDGCKKQDQYTIFLIYCFPVFIAGTQLYMFLRVFRKESPRYLLINKEVQLALHSYESIYNTEFAENEIKKHEDLLKDGKADAGNYEDGFCELIMCKKGTTKGMRVGTFVHIFQQISGINCIILYSTMLYQDIGEGLFLARMLTIFGTFARILSLLVLLPIMGKLNIKTLIIAGHTLMGCGLLCVAFIFNNSDLKYLAVCSIYIYLMAFGCSIGPLCWSYTSQCMPDKGMALGTGMNWSVFTVSVLFFPYLIDYLGLQMCLIIYSCLNILGAVYFFFDMLEIKGKSKNEVREMFSKYR